MTIHIKTPLIQSLSFNFPKEANVWLKMEALQPCGSFKARGVGYACSEYVRQGAKGLVSSSGGNAGLAVAYSGRCLNVPVTVVVPTTTKQKAIDLIEKEGATVIVYGDVWAQAHEHALTFVDETKKYIHPFDNALLWDGHATLIDEIKEAGVKPDCIILSVGGGGLLCGVAQGLRQNNWADVPILAVETKGADSFALSLREQQHVSLKGIESIATSLGATKVALSAFELLEQHNIYSQVVSDKQAVDACLSFLNDHRVLVEPACGASLAVAYSAHDLLKDKKNIVVIVCGGVGVSVEQLNQWKESL